MNQEEARRHLIKITSGLPLDGAGGFAIFTFALLVVQAIVQVWMLGESFRPGLFAILLISQLLVPAANLASIIHRRRRLASILRAMEGEKDPALLEVAAETYSLSGHQERANLTPLITRLCEEAEEDTVLSPSGEKSLIEFCRNAAHEESRVAALTALSRLGREPSRAFIGKVLRFGPEWGTWHAPAVRAAAESALRELQSRIGAAQAPEAPSTYRPIKSLEGVEALERTRALR